MAENFNKLRAKMSPESQASSAQETARLLAADSLHTRAEQIVRAQEYACVGAWGARDYCATNLVQPLCSACQKLADAIAAALTAETTRREQAERERDEAKQLIGDVLEDYEDELTKEACDRCEQCGQMVMCSFHSVLSALDKGAWTNPAVERDNLRRKIATLESRADTAEQRARKP